MLGDIPKVKEDCVIQPLRQVTVGLDAAMHQMMLQMMQSQQTMLEMLNKHMDAKKQRRKDREAAQAARLCRRAC